MPCNSDYLEPRREEIEIKRACENIVFLAQELGESPPDWAVVGANDCYGRPAILFDAVPFLCDLCKRAGDEIIYNGRSPGARKAADWWDEHKAADAARKDKEKMELERLRELEIQEFKRIKEKYNL